MQKVEKYYQLNMNKEYVVKRNEDFNKIIKEGKKHINSCYIVYYLPSLSSDIDHFRIGYSVGKKLGHAPYRNYEKRIMRSIITQIRKNIVKYDYVIIARPRCKKASYASKEKELSKLFKEIKHNE